MSIEQLVADTTFNTSQDFLDSLRSNNINQLREYLLFNLDLIMKKELLESIHFLADDMLWSEKELESYEVIAKTIDNDYLLSNDCNCLIIPSHLNKEDSEIIDMPIWTLLVQFEKKELQTNILSLN